MKLLFDESLSPRLVPLLATSFRNRRVRFEMGLPVPAIVGYLNTPQSMI